MAEATKSVRITCPRCGAEGEAPIWDEIDAQTARRDARHVLNETIFEVKCNQCGNALSLNYPLVYHDGESRFFIQYVTDPAKVDDVAAGVEEAVRRMIGKAAQALALADKADEAAAEEAGAAAAAAPDALDGYLLRIVASRNALREKAVILRNGLDDRAVEVLKLTSFNLAASQGKLKGATEAYFGGVKKSGDILIDFVGGRRHRETKVPRELYESVLGDVRQFDPNPNGQLVVDAAWAGRFLAQRKENER